MPSAVGPAVSNTTTEALTLTALPRRGRWLLFWISRYRLLWPVEVKEWFALREINRIIVLFQQHHSYVS